MIDIAEMKWLNKPVWEKHEEHLSIHTAKDTDYWQRTHYGFQRDNAHAFVREIAGNFRVRARFHFAPTAQYDQCGLLIRENADCWFKCSTEYENESVSRLGSVFTNAGYSDWATQDISSSIKEMSYEVEFSNRDLIARYSLDGIGFKQMRIGHLQSQESVLQVGIYGCSPEGEGFTFDVIDLQIVKL